MPESRLIAEFTRPEYPQLLICKTVPFRSFSTWPTF